MMVPGYALIAICCNRKLHILVGRPQRRFADQASMCGQSEIISVSDENYFSFLSTSPKLIGDSSSDEGYKLVASSSDPHNGDEKCDRGFSSNPASCIQVFH